MSGIERRLVKLEAASVLTEQTLVVFVSFVPSERALPASGAVDGRVWHREPDELEEAFLGRVASEAGPARPGCGAVAFLE
jgi:hypothetical protein